jgi:hypothetical protein
MEKKKQRMQNRRNQGTQIDHLKKEAEVLGELLNAFEMNGVNALVIFEKKGRKMGVISNGISNQAMLSFVINLFLDYPEFYKLAMEIVATIMAIGIEEADGTTVH